MVHRTRSNISCLARILKCKLQKNRQTICEIKLQHETKHETKQENWINLKKNIV